MLISKQTSFMTRLKWHTAYSVAEKGARRLGKIKDASQAGRNSILPLRVGGEVKFTKRVRCTNRTGSLAGNDGKLHETTGLDVFLPGRRLKAASIGVLRVEAGDARDWGD